MQDSRSYTGNSMMWFSKNYKGYTSDVSRAHVFTKEEAIKQNKFRSTDIPWPTWYIDAHTQPTVDHQKVNIKDALSAIDIQLAPKEAKRHSYRCENCGRFVSALGSYSGSYGCVKCS